MPDSLRKLFLFLLLLGIPFVLLYWFLYSYLIGVSPLTRGEMDSNGDGRVSFFEADYAGNFETREFLQDGLSCTEYVSLKDGKILKTRCEQ